MEREENGRDHPWGLYGLGNFFAVFAPPIGLLYGLALIAAADEEGPWITGFSFGMWVLYTGVVVLAVSL